MTKDKLKDNIENQIFNRANVGICNSVKFPIFDLIEERLSRNVSHNLENQFAPLNSKVFNVNDLIRFELYINI